LKPGVKGPKLLRALESVLKPTAALSAGYPALMPTYEGQIGEVELVQIIAFLKAEAASGEESGE